ncbi:MAG: YeeE/YedE family protein [Bizionia sp.]|nr:YeeE/YedE family protein [Bizionia sp.]
MKKVIAYLAVGFLLGILFIKSEVASWFRIYEMFQFKSFHMYGVIGSAVVIGIIAVQYLKYKKAKDFSGETIEIAPKDRSVARYLLGGIIFGLGWALAGACPGPMFVLLGTGFVSVLLLIFGALLGTFVYGAIRHKLPH